MESSTVGEQLRQQRLLLGLSLEEIASQTHIQKSFLEALESNNFDRIPGAIYVKGFLRQYAEQVRLKPDDILKSYHQQINADPWEDETGPASQASKSRQAPGRGKLLLVVVLAVPVLILLYYLQQSPAPQVVEPPPSPVVTEEPPPSAPAEVSVVGQASVSSETATIPEKPLVPQPEWPPLPKRARIKGEAKGETELRVKVDDLPESTYHLVAGSRLSWLPQQKISVESSNPEGISISLNGTLLPFDREGTIVLAAD